MLLQGNDLQKLSPESHEQRAQLRQVHIDQFCQLVGGLGFLLKGTETNYYVADMLSNSAV
ncbi:hypothetical protein EYF80_026825 [Liparis tanakae]|uniref:Uncharacterized protein n=1 Tax=Liparis tanakae TaxID=230148 RepID=A0A4Z2HCD4_9TELE|nr:hypothetical protein EYF80_026825 [Liparis tanakae]